MFLMLVISRLSIVRTTSAASRIASVVSLNHDVQSTITRSWLRRSASRTRLHARRRDQLGHLRRGRGEQHPDPGRVVDDERVERLGLAGLELRDEVRDRLVLRVQVEQDADVAELERAVDEDDRLAELGRGRDREVDRDRRPADAALRAEDRDDLAVVSAVVGRRCAPPPVRCRDATGAIAPSGSACPARGCRPVGSTR